MTAPLGEPVGRPYRNPPNPTDTVAPEERDEREFSLGQVLTIACADLDVGQLFCPYGEFLDVVGYLLGDVPLIADLPDKVTQQARPVVLSQHPDLAGIEPPEPLAPDTTVLTWLNRLEQEHGARLTLLRPPEATPS